MVHKKLLVLDVNGLLLDTYFHKGPLPEVQPDARVGNFYVYKRRFCEEFLQFCLDNFTVGVWSSAREYNVNNLVDFIFGDLKGKLAFSWHQSDCTDVGLKAPDNKWKPLFLKELSKLWKKSKADLPWNEGDYNALNTLLVDDTPYKAILNPPNTAIFPRTYTVQDRDDDFLGGALRSYLEGIRDAESVQTYVESNPFGEPSITPESPLWSYVSEVLLKVKDALKDVSDALAQALPLVTTTQVFRQDKHRRGRSWRSNYLSESSQGMTDGVRLPEVGFPSEALEWDEALEKGGQEEGGGVNAKNVMVGGDVAHIMPNEEASMRKGHDRWRHLRDNGAQTNNANEVINHTGLQPFRSLLQWSDSIAPQTTEVEARNIDSQAMSDLAPQENWLHTASIESNVTNDSVKDTIVGCPPPEQRSEWSKCCQQPNAIDQAPILRYVTSSPLGEGADGKCSKNAKPCDEDNRSSLTGLEEDDKKYDEKHLECVGLSLRCGKDDTSLLGQGILGGHELSCQEIPKEGQLGTNQEGNGEFYGGNNGGAGMTVKQDRDPSIDNFQMTDDRQADSGHHEPFWKGPDASTGYKRSPRRSNYNHRPHRSLIHSRQEDHRRLHRTRRSECTQNTSKYGPARRNRRWFNRTSKYNSTPSEEQRDQRCRYSSHKVGGDTDQNCTRVYQPCVRGWQQKQDATPMHAPMYAPDRAHTGNCRDSTNTTGQNFWEPANTTGHVIPINLPQPPVLWNEQRGARHHDDGGSHHWPEADQGFEQRTAYGNSSARGRPDSEFRGRGRDFGGYGKWQQVGSVERESGAMWQHHRSGGTSRPPCSRSAGASKPPYSRSAGASRPNYNRDHHRQGYPSVGFSSGHTWERN